MSRDFEYLTFSIYDISDLSKVADVIRKIYESKLNTQKAVMYNDIPTMEEYFNPKKGGRHLVKFSFWSTALHPNKVFFASNYEDGLFNLCKKIQTLLGCPLTMCTLSNESNPHPMFMFYYSQSNIQERLIQVYKEDKWVFYEIGKPISIENMCLYNKRLVKDRLNNGVIENYLLKLGVSLYEMDTQIKAGYSFLRKEW